METKTKRIAVIGAGPCGLPAIKCCVDEGFEVVCYEKTGYVGGLWRYHDDDREGVPSVMKFTVINTSKELSSYSDFPPPKEFPNFMPHDKMLKYFEMYADHFDLHKHIRFNYEVVKVMKADGYEITGRWIVLAKSTETGVESLEVFDGVMVCSGHHAHPRIPKFRFQEKFRGKIMHTHSLKTVQEFTDSRVLVIGVGNSGLDAAAEISSVAKQVYLSTRRGSWITGKSGDHGLPNDALHNNRLYNTFFELLGWKLYSMVAEQAANSKCNHSLYGLKPKHRLFSQHPAMNDALPSRISYGLVKIKQDVVRFEENGVVFEGEDKTTEIDAVILATGYNVTFPFLPEDIVNVEENKVSLYKFCFPASLSHPSLVIIGLTQAFGCVFPIAEHQCRWFACLMAGKTHLPKKQIMLKDIEETQRKISERFVDSPRHTLEVDYVPYMDDIAKQYGVKPNLLKYFFTDQKLFWACLLYPCMSYQYRIEGPRPWPEARETILSYPERVSHPLSIGKAQLDENFFHPSLFGLRIWKPLLSGILIAAILLFIMIVAVFILWV